MLFSLVPRKLVGRVLSVSLLALGAVAVPTVHSSGEAPKVEMRNEILQPPSSLTAQAVTGTAGWTRFASIESGDTVLVGADWGGSDTMRVQVRGLDDRTWTEWFELVYEESHSQDSEEHAEHEPDGQHDAAANTGSDPVWLGQTRRIEIRARGELLPIELTRVDVAGGDGLSWMPPELRPGAAAAATGQPQILPRSSWGADESLRRYTPREFNRANFAIVHHTVSRNDYAQEESDDIVNAIYAYHVLQRGWDDIAYNFLVDRFGTIWEGRFGGMQRPVIGGHAAGFNGGSIGIAAIGNYQTAEPSPELLSGLEDILAWKLDLHHIDPDSTTDEIAGGGSSNRYKAGTRVTLPAISAHRISNSTTCPGDLLFEHVMGLNNDVAFRARVDEQGHPKAYGGPAQNIEQPLDGVRPTWDVEFTRDVTWQLAIVDQDNAVVRRGTGFAPAGPFSLDWDMRDGDGNLAAPGRYVGQLDAAFADGTPITPVRTVFDVTDHADRAAGPSREATAVELSARSFPQNERIVVASSEAFPDALVAGPLAGSLDAPILLVPSVGVPLEVVDEIRRLHASKAYIVGGKGRIPVEVEADLRASGITSITRLSGFDRYETSAAVAQFLINRDHPREALLALGEHPVASRAFPDALSAGAFGAARIAPVLLTAPTVLPGPIEKLLGGRPWFDGLVAFGGTGAISPSVVDRAALAAGIQSSEDPENPDPVAVLRIAGKDRYETSVLAAEELLRRWAADLEEDGPNPYLESTGLEVILASGVNWPDALGASAAAVRRRSLFVLVAPDVIGNSAATDKWLTDRSGDLAHAIVSGGPGAVSEQVRASVAARVSAQGPSSEPGQPWPGEATDGSFPFPVPLFPSAEPEPEPSASPTTEPSPSASPTTEPSPTAEPSPSPTDGEPTDQPTEPA